MPKLIVLRDVDVPMRDGTLLRADVYYPDDGESFPVLLQRTPYGKGFASTSFALWAAENGYAVVLQDTRGRWNSEGNGYPFVHEQSDGYDTVEWAARQPWSNGKVGMFGESYVGYTQMAAAAAHPPALKAIIPSFTFCEPRAIMYSGNALNLGAAVSWGLLAGAQMAILRHPAGPELKTRWLQAWAVAVDGMAVGSTFSRLPLDSMPLIGRDSLMPLLADVLDHPTSDEYWQRVACRPDQIDVPALHIGGWYDIFIASTLGDFCALQEAGRAPQRVLIGPWVHGAFDGLAGEVDFGIQAYAMSVLPDEIQLNWFDYWLKDKPNGVLDEPPVRLFMMGENRWRSENEWPLARTQYVPYYLHSAGQANTLNGDGVISPDVPGSELPDHFLYNPIDPVPTRGGGLCCWQAALPDGAYDQRPVELRPDVLVYSTPPLEMDLEVTGPLEVYLWAATNAPTTDFTAKLVDVHPDGYARNLSDGILRLGPQTDIQLQPGQPVEFAISLGATSNLFRAGHRLRLEVSSSNFPRFDRNLNTGQEASSQPAMQTIFHDAQHPSHILLPVIPR